MGVAFSRMRSPWSGSLVTTLAVGVAISDSAAAARVGAQAGPETGPAPLAPGAVFRFRGRDLPSGVEPRRPVTLVGRRGDTLLFRQRDGRLGLVPLDRITDLEVARGRRRWSERAWGGARVGAIALGVPTILATSAAFIQDRGRAPSGCDFICIPNSVAIGVVGTFVTGVATVTGAAIGVLAPGTRWTRVDTSAVRLGIAPTPNGGATLAVGFRF